jgi:hypothetical protein
LHSPERTVIDGERRGLDRMGNRPSSTIIYGFTYSAGAEIDAEERDDLDSEYKRDAQWKSRVYALCGVPETRPTDVDWSEWNAAKEIALRTHGQRVSWGCTDNDDDYAFGFVFAQGDWDAPEIISELTPPTDAEVKLRALCEYYGVSYEQPKWLLLSSYG